MSSRYNVKISGVSPICADGATKTITTELPCYCTVSQKYVRMGAQSFHLHRGPLHLTYATNNNQNPMPSPRPDKP
jgi:hypothetical protein